ncbi:MAG TPA: monovalent cation/H+ antiporter subunit D family protein, partial [Candidatus Methanoperedenaceae archaeon]|nr:monovalent cation/H+ antiporter subunit D family protein [Candidatus Methanoperedenaceae archaeon]
SFLWILTTIYSIGYMRAHKEHEQARYFFFFAIALSSAIGVAFAANLFTLFIFYEILTLSTYPLVIHIQTPEAMGAGRKYLVYLLTAGVFLLFSIAAVYHYTGTTDFAFNGIVSGHDIPIDMLRILFVTFMIGCTKAAFMPLHSWLPTAMIAPTPVSALLHAVAVVKAGVFLAVRVILYVFGIDVMQATGVWLGMAYFVSFTILMASVFALTQDNLKKRLAYSTVSQLSYIVLGAVLLTPSSITGGMLHIANHAFAKITLFFSAGAIIVAAKKENISEMNGIGKQMPFTMLAFTIGAISMIGLPPAAGFISKWYIIMGAVEIHQLFFMAVLLISAILNVGYFFPVIYTAFFRQPEGTPTYREAPLAMLVPLTVTAIITLILGLFPQAPYLFLELVKIAVANVTGG